MSKNSNSDRKRKKAAIGVGREAAENEVIEEEIVQRKEREMIARESERVERE